MNSVDRQKVSKLILEEEKKFVKSRPKSRQLFERARRTLLAGVPMNWMVRWAGPFPIFIDRAKGKQVIDIDGHEYIDFCLGDTGAMFGHSPDPVVKAVIDQVQKGITLMLPTEDSIWVGEELKRRFRLPYWQVAMTATDANRFSIRLAREITKRNKILVFNGCYHGSVDEALISLNDGIPAASPGNFGPAIDPTMTTKVIEFNDIDALDKALAAEDVACVLCEPAMTNVGIILPDTGYHDRLREITNRYGTFLIIDETHTICSGPGGYTGKHGLKPDIITIGKPIAGGIPAAAYGISDEIAERVRERTNDDHSDESGIGGTLSGNALAISAMRATLEHVITEDNYEKMTALAKLFENGVAQAIKSAELPWHVIRLGTRIEYRFRSVPPRNGTEAEMAIDRELDRLMHLFLLNRGVLMTPFHNMALISPYTGKDDIDKHTEIFSECISRITS